MSTFLEELVVELNTLFPQGLGKVCIVFPTQRAGLFYRKLMAKDLKNPVWAPDIFSVENFFRTISDKQIPDNLTLVMELFEVYRKYFPEETFDRFYHWGSMMLRDFDEVDRYLCDAGKLFRNVKQLKEIDAEFGFSPEEVELLTKFWSTFYGDEKELGLLKREFLKTWTHLHEVYLDFRASLEKRNLSYEGMIYRKLAENPDLMLEKIKSWDKIIFAGLYDPSKAEEKIITELIQSGKAFCYYDSDTYYVEDNQSEAGTFFRKSKLTEGKFLWNQEHFKNKKKKIEFVGASQSVGQAKAAGVKLSQLIAKTGFIPEETALVLPDENLLFPVLNSIPSEIESFNVTMGYPLKSTPLASLMNLISRLQKNSGKGSFYHGDVMRVLNHPYIQYLEKDGRMLNAWKNRYFKNKWIHISLKHLSGQEVPGFFKKLFSQPSGPKEIFSYLLSILQMLQKSIAEADRNKGVMESEFIFQYYSTLKRLHELVTNYSPDLNSDTLWKLFAEISSTIRIPFTGEPLKGLQVMGFLETRALDFKNIFVLSVNEGILPAPSKAHSFIPFAIRKGFGMNTQEHQESRYAYYFYRLLQRAENIVLVYNTETKSISGGEKSRYLLQLEHELVNRFPEQIELTQSVLSPEIQLPEVKEIRIEKTQEVLAGIDALKHFSPSALSTYINCSLQYYFQYIAKLSEPDEVEDTMDEGGFGSVFHNAMERIYAGEKEITAELIDRLKNVIPGKVAEAFKHEFTAAAEKPEGKNILLIKIITDLVEKILDSDKADAPFRIMNLEENIYQPLQIRNKKETVQLYGKIDRVDDKEKYYRILDYKTGKVNVKFPEDLQEIFSDPKHKIIFQALFYGYLSSKKLNTDLIRIGIYPLKTMQNGILYPKKDELLTREDLSGFEKGLTELISEIHDPQKPFLQTEDQDRCRYCAFKRMCNR